MMSQIRCPFSDVPTPTPVVMWHGAGDWSASAPMERMRRVIEENTPNGTYVYSVVIGGDGTFLLGASKILSRDKPVIGFNTDPTRSEGHLCLPKRYRY